MMGYLANTPPPDPMISGDWIIAVIGALASAFALFYGKRQGLKEATNNVTLQSPLPEVSTRKVLTPPSWDAHQALRDRVTVLEVGLADLRRESINQYHELLKAGGEREVHLSDKLDGIARSIHSRIDELMQPRTRRAP
jgi:hypothetical protein